MFIFKLILTLYFTIISVVAQFHPGVMLHFESLEMCDSKMEYLLTMELTKNMAENTIDMVIKTKQPLDNSSLTNIVVEASAVQMAFIKYWETQGNICQVFDTDLKDFIKAFGISSCPINKGEYHILANSGEIQSPSMVLVASGFLRVNVTVTQKKSPTLISCFSSIVTAYHFK